MHPRVGMGLATFVIAIDGVCSISGKGYGSQTHKVYASYATYECSNQSILHGGCKSKSIYSTLWKVFNYTTHQA